MSELQRLYTYIDNVHFIFIRDNHYECLNFNGLTQAHIAKFMHNQFQYDMSVAFYIVLELTHVLYQSTKKPSSFRVL